MELSSIIFAIALFFLGFFFNKYFLLFLSKNNFQSLVDNQFDKPQAFHQKPTYRLGGLTIFISLIFALLFLYSKSGISYFEYFSFCTLFFILGFVDDLKITIRPKFRLLIMIGFLIVLIIYNQFTIEAISLEYLENLMKIDIFALIFVILCFLFIVNGCNLIDGFNGLLSIHALIIFFILLFINLGTAFYYGIPIESNFINLFFYIILILFSFLIFNFPNAKMFLGDSGSYLVGTLIAISTINTNNYYPEISSFFFCALLFYLFFEVFFSFFRKLLYARQSPLLPDKNHLHMLLYNQLLKSNKKMTANFKVSIYINLTYFFLMIPAIIFMNNTVFCRFYFFFLLASYTFFYGFLYKKTK
jgi:UDP-GlcNAc:undecaprenyl-phosphate/decaprenyl-phosphate GlcNAc-1-phosphate transferase